MITFTANEALATKTGLNANHIDIADRLELLSSGWNNDVLSSEISCINYFKLLKSVFLDLHLLFLNKNLANQIKITNKDSKEIDNNYPEFFNVNYVDSSFEFSTIDKSFLDHYFNFLNTGEWYYDSSYLCGNQDINKYYIHASVYTIKNRSMLTIKDAFIRAVDSIEIPKLISLLKTLLIVHINVRGYIPERDNIPVVKTKTV